MSGTADAAAHEEVKRRAMDLLARREHSVKELAEKLERRTDADSSTVRSVVEDLADKDLVSDERFAAAYARDAVRLNPKASRRIVSELTRKGVPARVAAPAVESAFEEEEVDDRSLAFRLAETYRGRLEDEPPATQWRRLAGYLQRRGFGGGLVYDVCEALLPEAGEGGR
ncbi:MAG: regulatory protein RecX [Gemmatimonadota bacterium]|nr:regulatory protein RecX [Gemmatimonadota bacterium]